MQQTGIQHLVEYISYGLAYFYFLPSSMDKVFLVRCVLFAELFFFFCKQHHLYCSDVNPSFPPAVHVRWLACLVW